MAASSLPVPLSPIRSTGRLTGATFESDSWNIRNVSDCQIASTPGVGVVNFDEERCMLVFFA
jgi:hypothetical protein